MSDHFFENIRGGLIVSCQALEDEPLHGSDMMAKMALAADQGGAVCIRANSVQDIAAIKKATKLPVIGIIKRDYEDSEIYITPTLREVRELMDVGVDVIALDATGRSRPGGETLEELVTFMKSHGQKVMADISTLEEALYAESIGVSCVSTTLSGYTPYSPRQKDPDFKLLQEAVRQIRIPVIAEGRIHTPEQAAYSLELGAHAVVVGSAITRPKLITERFAHAIRDVRKGQVH
ncbi:MAG TPA: N-acetylmannosamine-6-phosphate 2-epimerase [Paenibacillus cookii]|uniref:Putative N-acetylmannosamine-6-phosphate 2-epimerase n=1 Tax=Paenibacillus cookii TaxID=157839 RepID=A0ABQ4M143_9BACL|nr:N-acetylmannosamine-6-phosphate 2-epimerase [Paenibacillus cookii]KHF37550.1 putative N-acetylmannosamine-6-phosphate 2-epimerase [Paenibacillus sp. P1XP2]GIO68868.1 putative N-acetylmannosamine-6-phosphate 2-epimerase [Paenibacillus cookii]HWO55442.1 N-acetylmannosamine-6-phosphate 2-epimerase [Paenibacillus cookii]